MDEPEITVDWDAVDWDRVDEATLALLLLGLHAGWRTWKGFEWQTLNRLHEKGFIADPRNKAKSVLFSDLGIQEANRFFREFFQSRAEPTSTTANEVEESE